MWRSCLLGRDKHRTAITTRSASAITINKSPSPSDQSDGLSGDIDLKISSALSRRDGGAYKISYEKDSLGGLAASAFTLSAAHHSRSNLTACGFVARKPKRPPSAQDQ